MRDLIIDYEDLVEFYWDLLEFNQKKIGYTVLPLVIEHCERENHHFEVRELLINASFSIASGKITTKMGDLKTDSGVSSSLTRHFARCIC